MHTFGVPLLCLSPTTTLLLLCFFFFFFPHHYHRLARLLVSCQVPTTRRLQYSTVSTVQYSIPA